MDLEWGTGVGAGGWGTSGPLPMWRRSPWTPYSKLHLPGLIELTLRRNRACLHWPQAGGEELGLSWAPAHVLGFGLARGGPGP